MKIPINHIIDSGASLCCITGTNNAMDNIKFKLKPLSFEKINIKKIDNPNKIDKTNFDLEDRDFWLLKFQFVNLTDTPLEPMECLGHVFISDPDIQYGCIIDRHLCAFSDYAKKSGLSKICEIDYLQPLHQYEFALAYCLPKDINARYYLSVFGGKISVDAIKIPITSAVKSGAWFKCKVSDTLDDDFVFNFHFKSLSFERIDRRKIDDPEKLELDEGILWMMKIEVVNLNKENIASSYVRDSIVLLDQEDFEFSAIKDDHLTYSSKYAKSAGLNRFGGWSDIPQLRPKIKASGALAFLLPSNKGEYCLSVKGGNIKEV